MTRLTIIIPSGNDVSFLEDTLVSVLANRPPHCEIVVPHTGNYDDPYGLHGEIRFLEVPARSGTAGQIAKGIAESSGTIVHLLAAGCEVKDGWSQPALERFNDPKVAAVSPIVFTDATQDWIRTVGVTRGLSGRRVERGNGISSASTRLAKLRIAGPTAMAAFYRRDAIEMAGGWPTAVGALADLDIALSLKRLGLESVVEHDSHVVCPSPTNVRVGAFTRSRHAERLYWRHSASLVCNLLHPAVLLTQCITAGGPLAMTAAAMGKLVSVFEITGCRRHARMLTGQKTFPIGQHAETGDNGDDSRRAA